MPDLGRYLTPQERVALEAAKAETGARASTPEGGVTTEKCLRDARGWIPKYYENGIECLPNGAVDILKGKGSSTTCQASSPGANLLSVCGTAEAHGLVPLVRSPHRPLCAAQEIG